MPSRIRRHSLSVALVAVLLGLLVLPLTTTVASAEDPDPDVDTPGLTTDVLEVAEETLETVRELVEPATPQEPPTADSGQDGQDLTLALRDLMLARQHLPRGKAAEAARILARPTDAATGGCDSIACYDVAEQPAICGVRTCVHRVATGPHAATARYAAGVLNRVETVAARYAAAGYRPPVGDGARGGGANKVDIYLAELGADAYYGYCTSDDDITTQRVAAAYCVLDDNYAEDVYQGNTAVENVEVTAAHEFFHVVQFAYDLRESAWFMESTATWAEDEIYDSINDNRAYLPYGPLGKPGQPLGTSTNLNVYGAWIFIRYLTENYPDLQGGLPRFVADTWLKAAHTGAGARSMTSSQAISSALADRGTTYETQFARFAVWNRRPARFYTEGTAYRPAPLALAWTMTGTTTTRTTSFTANRNAARHVRFTRGRTSKAGRLRVTLNLNSIASGGVAWAVVKPRSGAERSKRITLDNSGNRTISYWFGPKTAWVEITMVNAGGSDSVQRLTGTTTR